MITKLNRESNLSSPSFEAETPLPVRLAIKEALNAIYLIRSRVKALEDSTSEALAKGQYLVWLILRVKILWARAQLVISPFRIGLRKEWKVKSPSKLKSNQPIGLCHRWLTVIKFKQLRTDHVVLFDWAKRYTVVATFQILGFLTHALTENDFLKHAPYYVFFNTFIMMLLQSEVGARHTETQRDLKLPFPKTVDELYAQIPAMMIGRKGFRGEIKEKFLSFASLWPIEWFVLTFSNTAQIFLAQGNLTQEIFVKMLFVNILSCTIFGVYLALRWASWDWIVDLVFLPAAHHVASLSYHRRCEELGEKHSATCEHITKAEFFDFLSSSELKMLHSIYSPQFRKMVRAEIAEMTYRYILGFIDAYIVFGLFGSWLPPFFDWLSAQFL